MNNDRKTTRGEDRASERPSAGVWKKALTSLAAAGLCMTVNTALAQVQWPADYGQNVAGYQELFQGTTLNSNWQVANAGVNKNVYTLNGKGVLKVATADGDPNHLLLVIPGYDQSNQEVLARFRVTNFGTGDGPRGGIGLVVTAASGGNFSRGIDLHFRDFSENNLTGKHLTFLDDARAWGTSLDFKWETGVWYWMRVSHTIDAGVPHAFGKIWAADGQTAEPADWGLTWDYTSTPVRTGYAGITAGSAAGQAEFECSYFLVKASGLPQVKVEPAAPPPEIANIVPADATSFVDATAIFKFDARSLVGISTTGVKVAVNGVDVTAKCTIEGSASTRNVSYSGPFVANTSYKVEITVTDNASGQSTQTTAFDTFSQNNPVFEAEDFNFESGKYIDNPTLSSTVASGSYFGVVGVQNIDRFDPAQVTATHAYRPYDAATGIGELVGTEALGSSEFVRQKFIDGQLVDTAVVDYMVGWTELGEWWNYTRAMPAGKYRILGRNATGNAGGFAIQIDKVLSGATTTIQTTAPIGTIFGQNTGSYEKYMLFPMKDLGGNDVVVSLGGVQTLRATLTAGGMNANFYMLVPTTVSGSLPPYVAAASPIPNDTAASPQGIFKVAIADRDTKAVKSSLKLTINGVDVTAASTITQTDSGLIVDYTSPNFLASGSTNTVAVGFSDNATTPNRISNSWSFVVADNPVLKSEWALPVSSANTPGFSVRMSKSTTATTSTAWTEDQLAGVNTVTASGYETTAVINYWGSDLTGNFPNDVPNFPGFDGASAENFAIEAIAYLQLDRGIYTFGVNSDDGFRVTAGAEAHLLPSASMVLGEFNGGRGSADTTFSFVVPTSGVYPFRLTYQQGGTGNSLEFFSVDATGKKILIGDTAAAGAIKAFRYSTALNPAAVSLTAPQSATKPANSPASFTVSASCGSITNTAVYIYQWQYNGAAIDSANTRFTGANSPTLTIPLLTMADAGKYRCNVILVGYPPVLSSEATLTVTEDYTAPALLKAKGSPTFDAVTLSFSEVLDESSVPDIANYTIAGLTINSATLVNLTNVILSTSVQTKGASYTVSVMNIKDLSGNQIANNASASFNAFVLAQGYATLEYFNNIGSGVYVSELIASDMFASDRPDDIKLNNQFSTPGWAYGDSYGGRASAIVTAPETGDYTFYIASDDYSLLFLSADENPSAIDASLAIASVAGATGQYEWQNATYAATQKSAPQPLVAGRKYHMTALWKEGGGGDGVSVGWTLPSQAATVITVIPGSSIATYADAATASITISNQPASVTLPQNRKATFTVAASATSDYGTSIDYQWRKNGVNIAGATGASYTTPLAALADNGAKFQCVLSVPTKSVTTADAILTVTQDIEAPGIQIAGARANEGGNVVVVFDELVDPATATNANNYTIAGASVTKAALNANGAQVSLDLNIAIAQNTPVQVRNVMDLAGNKITSATAPIMLLANVLKAGDPVIPTSSSYPAAEAAPNAIDGITSTKYLNFDKLNAGFTVTPSLGSSVINGIGLTSANDEAPRDPASYKIEGSSDGTNFTVVATGQVAAFSGRFSRQDYYFSNQDSYTIYRIVIPTVADAANAACMQIAEVELLGAAGSVTPGVGKFDKIERAGANVILTWSGGGVLQAAGEVKAGAFVDVAGATSPYTVQANEEKRFYRLRGGN